MIVLPVVLENIDIERSQIQTDFIYILRIEFVGS